MAEIGIEPFDESEEDSTYCKECGACAESGCCPPVICKEFQCKYPGVYSKEYDKDMAILSHLYDCLLEMGVDSPHDLTIEQAKAVGKALYVQISDILTSVGHPDPFREKYGN